MSIQNITPNYSFSYAPMVSSVDAEEKLIMERLLSYGVTPTGDKTTDKSRLRRIEEKKAKQDNFVSNNYLTVSQKECEQIQAQKKERKKESVKDLTPNKPQKQIGAKLLGEQLFLAIKMKSVKDNYKITNYDEYDKIKNIS